MPDADRPRDHVDRLVAQWAGERPDLDTAPLAVSARVTRLARLLERASSRLLEGTDLHEGELSVLAALRRLGPPYALTPTDLYRSLLLSSGAMTNRIDRLERAGLVRRERSESDRRRVLVALTDKGRATIDELMDANVALLADELAILDRDEQRQLADLLRRLLASLEEG